MKTGATIAIGLGGVLVGALGAHLLSPSIARASTIQQRGAPPDPGPFSIDVPAGEFARFAIRYPAKKQLDALASLTDLRIVRGGPDFLIGESFISNPRQFDFPVARGPAELYDIELIEPRDSLSLTTEEIRALEDLRKRLAEVS